MTRPTPGNARLAVARAALIADQLAQGKELDQLLTRLRDAQGGYRPDTLAQPTGRGGQPSDPTLRLVLNPDEATQDLARLHEAIDNAAQWLLIANNIHCKWRPDHGRSMRCQNTQGCPDSAYRALGRHRCYPCDETLRKTGTERTRAAETRTVNAPTSNDPAPAVTSDAALG